MAPTPAPAKAEPEPPPQLVDAWYDDQDADGMPDFVELEQNRDPRIDECIVDACGGEAAAGRLVSAVNTLIILDVSGSMGGKIAGKGQKNSNSPRSSGCHGPCRSRRGGRRDLIRGRTRAAPAIKRAKGLKFGSTAPYGSRIEGERFVPDADEDKAVARMIQLRRAGASLRQVAEALTVEGFRPRGRRCSVSCDAPRRRSRAGSLG